MMVGTPRPSSPISQACARLELHLRGRIGAVAELVLEPLEGQRVDAAVGQEARHQEAGEPARRLRQHQEGVAHGRRHEPLVPGDQVLGPRPAVARGRRRGGVGAHVGAALLLRHAHADGDAALGGRRLEALVVGARQDLRDPPLGELRLQQQRRHRRHWSW